MGTSVPWSTSYPRRPPDAYEEGVYSNFDHVLNWEVALHLALDHRLYAQHSAKGFCGYVYACSEEEFAIRWYEEVWVNHRLIQIYRSDNLEKMILRVCDDFGNA